MILRLVHPARSLSGPLDVAARDTKVAGEPGELGSKYSKVAAQRWSSVRFSSKLCSKPERMPRTRSLGWLLELSDFLEPTVGLACLEAGKHVLIEKPIAASQDEASALIDAAERARDGGEETE